MLTTRCEQCDTSYDLREWIGLEVVGYADHNGRAMELRRCRCQAPLSRPTKDDIDELLHDLRESILKDLQRVSLLSKALGVNRGN